MRQKLKRLPKIAAAPPVTMPTVCQLAFRGATLRTSFNLHLTPGMLEFLCAVADDVVWDRTANPNLYRPDNWIASETALTKRGLIQRKDCRDGGGWIKDFGEHWENVPAYCQLTPIGEALVEMLKRGGLFVEATASAIRKARKHA